MAVVKANFVKRDKNERSKAKAHIKYIQHRQGKDGENSPGHCLAMTAPWKELMLTG